MNTPDTRQIEKVLENRATPEQAEEIARWLATPQGQKWLDNYIAREAEREEAEESFVIGRMESDKMYKAIISKIRRRRIFRTVFGVAAALVPLIIAGGLAIAVNNAVGGLFGPVAENTLTADAGQRPEIVFQDGSILYLNSGSTIHYPSHFGLGERRVRMEGEAYFEVAPNPKRPFTVEFDGGKITVLGTGFNVKSEKGEKTAVITLDHGKIEVRPDKADEIYILHPDQQLTLDKEAGKGKILTLKESGRFSLWRDDIIAFKDTPLTEVLDILSEWFDVDFISDDRIGTEFLYTFTTDNPTLDSVLHEMQLITPVRFSRDGREVKVHIEK